jgi:hypothetical protein
LRQVLSALWRPTKIIPRLKNQAGPATQL